MTSTQPAGLSNDQINTFLESYDPYIHMVVRNSILRQFVAAPFLTDELSELAQRVSIKLWQILEKHPITHPKAYIRQVVRTTAADMVHEYKQAQPLTTGDDSELLVGRLLISEGEDSGNPAEIVERRASFSELFASTMVGVRRLPPRQLRAMICSLKDNLDSLVLLVDAFKESSIDVESLGWPDGEVEKQRMRSLLSIARRKMPSLLEDRLVA